MDLRAAWTFLLKRNYEQALLGNPPRDAIWDKRLEKCGTLCQLGIANLFWRGTTLVFKQMKENKDPNLCPSILVFTFCLVLMAMGTVAALFPDTSPFPRFVAGLGALVGILSMFGSYHLDLLEYFPSEYECFVSMIVTSTAFTLYWSYAVQDPWIVHLVARLISGLWGSLCFCVGWIKKKIVHLVLRLISGLCGSLCFCVGWIKKKAGSWFEKKKKQGPLLSNK